MRRRDWLGAPAALAFRADGPRPVSATFPTQAPELAKEVVGVSHGNFKRVKELVEAQPTLAEATWDWGFGDWESALGGASHVGNRDIALYLIDKGAAPTIFSATMLGQVEVVRALVTAQPGIQRQKGPHGITLLSHARAGGAQAKDVLEYLQSLGDADQKPPLAPISDEEKAAIAGEYAWGAGNDERFVVALSKGQLTIMRPGGTGTARNLFHLGAFAFYPAGAEAAKVRFTMASGKGEALSIHDPEHVVSAKRVS